MAQKVISKDSPQHKKIVEAVNERVRLSNRKMEERYEWKIETDVMCSIIKITDSCNWPECDGCIATEELGDGNWKTNIIIERVEEGEN